MFLELDRITVNYTCAHTSFQAKWREKILARALRNKDRLIYKRSFVVEMCMGKAQWKCFLEGSWEPDHAWPRASGAKNRSVAKCFFLSQYLWWNRGLGRKFCCWFSSIDCFLFFFLIFHWKDKIFFEIKVEEKRVIESRTKLYHFHFEYLETLTNDVDLIKNMLESHRQTTFYPLESFLTSLKHFSCQLP